MYGCESWTVKKAEHQRIDAFELWCWRRLLRVPWTARRSNQSILKEISPGCSLVRLMKLQYFSHLSQGHILSPYLFNLYAEYAMRNTGLDEAQAGIKIAGRSINNLRYTDDTTLMAESKEELKSLLIK